MVKKGYYFFGVFSVFRFNNHVKKVPKNVEQWHAYIHGKLDFIFLQSP